MNAHLDLSPPTWTMVPSITPMFRRLLELAQLFSKLGTFSFGGPAAHIGQMEHEVVHARGWMTREQFVDLIGATNLIPGPNSTEMAAHIGYCRAGLPGSLVAGAGFVLPAVLLTGGIAWGYKRYGTLPQVEPLLYGIQPVVVAILMVASWRLGRPALKGWQGMLIGAAVAVSALAGADDVVTFLVGSVLGAILFA
jgi:chromate transporter